MADLTLLRHLAAKTGLGLKYLSKDEKISVLLCDIRTRFSDVVMKGGTAINRAYLAKSGVSRFSEDIFLDVISKDTLPETISSITDRMSMIQNFEVTGPHILHRKLRFDCHYTNEFGDLDRIMVEFYLSGTQAVKKHDVLIASPFIETYPTIFTIYSLEDLLARKLFALYNRGEGKDIYDLFYILTERIDYQLFFQSLSYMADYYQTPLETFPIDLVERVQRLKANAFYIGNATNHFIPRQRRPDWTIFIDTLIRNLLCLFEKKP